MRVEGKKLGMESFLIIDEQGFKNNFATCKDVILLLRSVYQDEVAFKFLIKEVVSAEVIK